MTGLRYIDIIELRYIWTKIDTIGLRYKQATIDISEKTHRLL